MKIPQPPSQRIGILGTGMCVPEKVLTNSDLEKMVDTTDEWIRTRTGIEERRVAPPGSATSDLAFPAAKQALENAGIAPEDLELIIVGTTTPDMLFPSTACLVQRKLGALNAACFDLSAACSGSLYSIITGQQYLASGRFKNALVVGAEVLSGFIDWKDRTTCVLFGDGAGACVLGPVAQGGIHTNTLGADGTMADVLCMPGGGSKNPPSYKMLDEGLHFLQMNGGELFKVAVRRMAEAVAEVLAAAEVPIDKVKLFIPHQANIRIIEAVAKYADISMDKVFLNLQRYGNTSAASNLIALHEAVDQGRIERGDYIVMVSFGAGLTWSAVLLEW